jgi:hypothetical protein
MPQQTEPCRAGYRAALATAMTALESAINLSEHPAAPRRALGVVELACELGHASLLERVLASICGLQLGRAERGGLAGRAREKPCSPLAGVRCA